MEIKSRFSTKTRLSPNSPSEPNSIHPCLALSGVLLCCQPEPSRPVRLSASPRPPPSITPPPPSCLLPHLRGGGARLREQVLSVLHLMEVGSVRWRVPGCVRHVSAANGDPNTEELTGREEEQESGGSPAASCDCPAGNQRGAGKRRWLTLIKVLFYFILSKCSIVQKYI